MFLYVLTGGLFVICQNVLVTHLPVGFISSFIHSSLHPVPAANYLVQSSPFAYQFTLFQTSVTCAEPAVP